MSDKEIEKVKDKLIQFLLRVSDFKFDNLAENELKFIQYGVFRRLHMVRFCIENIFKIFSSDRVELLTQEELITVQVYINSFFIHIYGIIDNLAWTIIFKHNLNIPKPQKIHLYSKVIDEKLSTKIKDHIKKDGKFHQWYVKYFKSYRNKLCHQIPFYIPPYLIDKSHERIICKFIYVDDHNSYYLIPLEQLLCDTLTIIELCEIFFDECYLMSN